MANKFVAAVAAGAAGAGTLTLLHQLVKQVSPDAPRLDNAAKEGIRRTIASAGGPQPSEEELHRVSLAGDLLANTAYYAAAVGFGARAAKWIAPLLGAGAGVGSVLAPGRIGLDPRHTARNEKTALVTVVLYLAGAVAAQSVYRALAPRTA